jgi:peptidoglycan/LPS O-acetylase OafA/YrhL
MLFSAVPIRLSLAGGAGLLAATICAAAMYVCIEYVHPFVGLLPGLLLFGMVLAPGSGVAAVLSTPLPQFLGKISYSLYLVHPFALFPLQMLGARLAARGVDPWLLWGAFVVLGFTGSVVAGALSYEVIELKLRRLLDNAFRRTLFRPVEGVDVTPDLEADRAMTRQ